jgi:hypothetical protein
VAWGIVPRAAAGLAARSIGFPRFVSSGVIVMLDLSTASRKVVFGSAVAATIVLLATSADLIFGFLFRRMVWFDLAFLASACCVLTMAHETWQDLDPHRKLAMRSRARTTQPAVSPGSERAELSVNQPAFSAGSSAQAYDMKPALQLPHRQAISRTRKLAALKV